MDFSKIIWSKFSVFCPFQEIIMMQITMHVWEFYFSFQSKKYCLDRCLQSSKTPLVQRRNGESETNQSIATWLRINGPDCVVCPS